MTRLHPLTAEATNASPGSSTLSLPPASAETSSKRRLLLVYIHGFMGSEASFSDFPAHVHHSLTGLLSESHVIYTRIYPRYKSRGEMRTAVENFISWLSPHLADDLDVILLGHSLGGIVAADAALLSSLSPSPNQKHRILGLINFDVPFLGLHPHVIPTGLRGLFQQKEETITTSQDTPSDIDTTTDPLFDPPFSNDIHLVERHGINGIMHFFHKNSHNLTRSIYNRILSPYQFAGCLNNYVQLRKRYKELMALEKAEKSLDRVRFVNYYTLSTKPIVRKSKGRVKSRGGDRSQNAETESGHTSASVQTRTVSVDQMYLAPPTEKLGLQYTSSLSSLDLSTEDGYTTVSEESVKEKTVQLNGNVQTEVDTTIKTTSKPHKFVLMPSHHWKHGDNSLWVPVHMENMDEVTAHQSLFVPHGDGRHYDQLVGEVVSQIEKWVTDDLSERMLQEESIDLK
ncbi:alpha/beta hydrolase [Aspergillus ibericus CBS 121593]|uniref:AB hydrolase-1 domain-containing protein n=1 Tax=Aspergillus ibericus CBS 121593 TaxID=1448316 RepID=A0A395H168_9EURO|nr:hypothetical protein BO80DRAFT_501957 [Aspergillus ibericus CBS 121593]RAL01383.1 hypothetical protein BO80DRAFT_501957 [Aspergillus ibericus CBS 121593]